MANEKRVDSFDIDCSDWGFGRFFVVAVIVARDDVEICHFHLAHAEYSHHIPMFSCYVAPDEDDEDILELAHNAAPRFFAEYTRDIFCSDSDCKECGCCDD